MAALISLRTIHELSSDHFLVFFTIQSASSDEARPQETTDWVWFTWLSRSTRYSTIPLIVSKKKQPPSPQLLRRSLQQSALLRSRASTTGWYSTPTKQTSSVGKMLPEAVIHGPWTQETNSLATTCRQRSLRCFEDGRKNPGTESSTTQTKIAIRSGESSSP